MYLKEGCWSFKHIKKERNKSKNRFKEQFDQQFDRKAVQYIADFEKTEFSPDNDLDNESIDEIKALLIDIPLLPSIVLNNENSKSFFTLLSLVEKAKKIAINLADRSFSHFLIIISKVSPNHINSANAACDIINTDLFAYFATNQYLSDKFYRIIIDTSASKYFTADYK